MPLQVLTKRHPIFTAYVQAKNLSNSIYTEAEEVAAAVDSHVAKFHSELLVYHAVTGGKGAAKLIALVVMVVCLLGKHIYLLK